MFGSGMYKNLSIQKISKTLLLWSIAFTLTNALATVVGPYPTIGLSHIPEALQDQYKQILPDMTDKSHCAVAWDSATEGDKMVLRCSIAIKMSAEGERRAMRYCEEKREEHKIKAPCRLIDGN